MRTYERCCNFISVSSSDQRSIPAPGSPVLLGWQNTLLSADVPHDRLSPAAGRRRESQRAKRSWSYSPELKPDRLRMRSQNRRMALDQQAHAPTDTQDPRAVSRLDDCLL